MHSPRVVCPYFGIDRFRMAKTSVGISNNVPFAAAFAAIPLVVMGVYLTIARRLGAFEAM